MKNDRLISNLNITKRKRTVSKNKEIKLFRKSVDNEKCKNVNVIFGLDNGATGTISCIAIYPDNTYDIFFFIFSHYITSDYHQSSIQYIARIDWKNLKNWFEDVLKIVNDNYNKKYKLDISLKSLVVLERPMINADRFKQSKNAARAFEATLIVLEMLNLENSYIVIDSKKWQHYFFGKNTMLLNLKNESKVMGIKFLKEFNKYDDFIEIIKKHGDADSLLISKFALEKLCK